MQVTYDDSSGADADADDVRLAARCMGLDLRARVFAGGRADCQVSAGCASCQPAEQTLCGSCADA